jgi:hypothetical protein
MHTGSFPKIGHTLRILPIHKECVAHFTGAWPAGFRPRWKRRPWWHLMTMGLSLCGGVAATSLIVTMLGNIIALATSSMIFTIDADGLPFAYDIERVLKVFLIFKPIIVETIRVEAAPFKGFDDGFITFLKRYQDLVYYTLT